MPLTTLTKVGNSMAVLLPKNLRAAARIDNDTPLSLSTPRTGVIVITALEESTESRLDAFREAERQIETNAEYLKAWPKGKTANELIRNLNNA